MVYQMDITRPTNRGRCVVTRFPVRFIFLAVLLAVDGCGRDTTRQAAALDASQQGLFGGVVAEKSLFITDLRVIEARPYATWNASYSVNDYRGAWTFGRLIDNMLPPGERTAIGRSRFVIRWLKLWEPIQTVNTFVVPARPLIRSLIIDPWRLASGCAAGEADEDCNLNFERAPFRLLAIVNRPDLRRPVSGLLLPSGGQGRFVFGRPGPP